MEFSGTVQIAAPRQAVWDFLVDFEGMSACGPGVDSIERLDDRHARVRARIGAGFIAVTFVLDLELTELEAPDRATIAGRGEAPGNQAEGRAEMTLSGPPEGPTDMAWRAEVELFGSLAGIGARLLESTAGKLVDDAFACVKGRLEARPPAA